MADEATVQVHVKLPTDVADKLGRIARANQRVASREAAWILTRAVRAAKEPQT